MQHVDHLPWSSTLIVVTDTTANGQSVESRSTRTTLSLSLGGQLALTAILAAADAVIPAATNVLINGNLFLPILSRNVVTILPHGDAKVLRVYATYVVLLQLYYVETEFSIMASGASAGLLSARQTLMTELLG